MTREERKERTQFLNTCRRYKIALIESSLHGDVYISDIEREEQGGQESPTIENNLFTQPVNQFYATIRTNA